MPLVYVHGVGNRRDSEYERHQNIRDGFFRRFLLRSHQTTDGSPPLILSPYWGQFGAPVGAGHASSPHSGLEILGESEPTTDAWTVLWYQTEAAHLQSPPLDLASIARWQPLEMVVDLLFERLIETEADPLLLADFAASAMLMVDNPQSAARLSEAATDDIFLDVLLDGFHPDGDLRPGAGVSACGASSEEQWETLGGGSLHSALYESMWKVRMTLERAHDSLTDQLSGRGVSLIRKLMLPPLARFLGDAMIYLNGPGTVGLIGAEVSHSLEVANRRRTDTDPMVVVAHSMGGNIAYDLLTNELADLQVDLLVTVGSQVGLLAELGLFRGLTLASGTRGTRPPNVGRWLNVLDLNDPLGFVAGEVFAGVEDFSFGTGSFLTAHSGYLLSPSFHRRVLDRADRRPR